MKWIIKCTIYEDEYYYTGHRDSDKSDLPSVFTNKACASADINKAFKFDDVQSAKNIASELMNSHIVAKVILIEE